MNKKTKKHVSERALFVATAALWAAIALAMSQGFDSQASITGDLAAAKLNAIPSSLTRFKEILDKDLDISVNGLNKNYVSYVGSLEDTVPLKVSNLGSVSAAGTQFFKEYGKHFGINNFKTDLKLTITNQDDYGQNYVSYRQYYKGIPVYGGEIIVQIDNNLQIHSAGGKFIPAVSSDTKAKITSRQAQVLARAAKGANLRAEASELTIYNPRVFDLKASNKNYLAWNITLANNDGPMERVFIDAKTGKIIQSWPLIKSIEFERINYPLVSRSVLGSDTITRRVYDCRPEGCTQNTTSTLIITDPATMRYEGDAATGNAQIDNLYNLLGDAFNYYKSTFDFWGANGLGGMGWSNSERRPLLISNAYAYLVGTSTLGHCPNCWGGAGALKFCDGTVNTTAVGHEYQHGVSAFNKPDTWGFDYINESGAVEEAYADIFGQAITRFVDGVSTWKIGRTTVAGVFRPWRNITDPTNVSTTISGSDCPCPVIHYGPEFDCSANDHGGVHRNSTVISHMAYVLTAGGNLNGCDVAAIGQDKVEQIFYHAFRHNLPGAPNFKDLYGGLLRSCMTIYGLWADECRNLVMAMQGAQLDQEKACGAAGDPPACVFTTVDPRGFAQFGRKKIDLKFVPQIEINTSDVFSTLDNVMEVDTPPIAEPAPVQDLTSNSGVSNTAEPSTPAPSTPVAVEKEVRTPSFDVTVDQDGKYITVNGMLHYYGKGAKCSGPRYFDPIIVRWGQGDDQPLLKSDNTFTASHKYDVKNKTYDLTVSITNSCFGSYTFRKTLNFVY